MPLLRTIQLKCLLLAAVAASLAACGGSGGGGSGGGGSGGGGGGGSGGGGSVTEVTISGRVTYDFVPATISGLDFAATEVRPVRLARIQFVASGASPVNGQTDVNGDYALTVPADRTGFIRVFAESSRTGTPGWRFRVVDNTSNDLLYMLDGSSVSSGTADSIRNLHAPSGWNASLSSYDSERAAAPFAILDTIYEAVQYYLAADAVNMPSLDIHWSPLNVDALDALGRTNPGTGEIGGSFYGIRPDTDPDLALNGIYLLGDADGDTEEFDRHVIVHEFAHYLIHRFSRNDNIGGPHALGDRVDPRVAFNEGWPTAYAGLVLEDPLYIDTGPVGTNLLLWFDIEAPPFSFGANPYPGWFSEESVWELVYDLVDSDVDDNDTLNLSFSEVLDAMSGPVAESRSLITIFTFWDAMKHAFPGSATQLDLMAADQSIDAVQDAFGTDETNDADAMNPQDVLPVYRDIPTDGTPINVCSTDEFTSNISGAINKLGASRLLRFTPVAPGRVSIVMQATEIPDGQHADPDFFVHDEDLIFGSNGPPNQACMDMIDPGDCIEPDPDPGAPLPGPFIFPVEAQDYVLEVHEWTNTNDVSDPDFPPIGRTCFDVTVTQL